MTQILSTILLLYACTHDQSWCTHHQVKMPRGTTQMTCIMSAPGDFAQWESQFHRGRMGWTIKRWSCRTETQVAWSYTGQ